MAKERSGAMLDQNAAAGYGSVAAQWRSTRWGMVSIQFVMTMAFSVLSPINPLLLPEFGVETEGAVDLWAGILGAVTSFVAAFASPLWGRLEPRHRRITALIGVAANVWPFLVFRALMGVFAGFSSASGSVCANVSSHRRRPAAVDRSSAA